VNTPSDQEITDTPVPAIGQALPVVVPTRDRSPLAVPARAPSLAASTDGFGALRSLNAERLLLGDPLDSATDSSGSERWVAADR
jgi:hypothetical protein